MKLSKKLLYAVATGLFAYGALLTNALAAATYPDKPVKLVTPYTPGGIVDVFARALGAALSEKWGQSVIVENKPGASEAIAAASVARSAPDGYTLFIGSDAAFVVNELKGHAQYDTDKDFDLIMRMAQGFGFLVVRPDLKITTLTELVDMAKGANPVTFGSEAVGSPAQFRMILISEQTPGAKFQHIPYKGMAAVVQDLLGGRIDAAWLPPHLAKPQIDAGKVVPVATYGDERNWMYPQVKTLQEYGYKNADLTFKMMLVGPKGMPKSVVEKIQSDVQSLLHDKSFVDTALKVNGYAPIESNSEEFESYIRETRPLYKKLLSEAELQ